MDFNPLDVDVERDPFSSNPLDIDPVTKNVIDIFESKPAEIPEGLDELLAQQGSRTVYGAIQSASNNSERSQQKELGASSLGHCRRYAQYIIEQTPPSDERDRTAAFMGTVTGAAIEEELKTLHPNWLYQHTTRITLAGVPVPGHTDVVVPASEGVSVEEWMKQAEEGYDGPELFIQGVWDLKSKDKLEVVKKMGPTQQQIYQLHTYCASLIEQGILDPSKPIWIQDNYYDRSGSAQEVWSSGHWYNPSVLHFIEEWLGEVTYAIEHGQEASKDMPRDWCHSWCDFATICRKHDDSVEGLIDDPEYVAAAETLLEGSQMATAGEKLKKAAKLVLANRESGSTGRIIVRKTEVAGSDMAFTRKPYTKIEAKLIPPPKPPVEKKPRAPRKKKEVEPSE